MMAVVIKEIKSSLGRREDLEDWKWFPLWDKLRNADNSTYASFIGDHVLLNKPYKVGKYEIHSSDPTHLFRKSWDQPGEFAEKFLDYLQ
jgi:hypothetical protein